MSAAALLSLLVLIQFPVLAVLRLAQAVDPRFVFAYIFVVSSMTYALYGDDKDRAESGGWRTPEVNLHLVELLGGWPVAFLAQRIFRHKIAKTRYQVAFWTIVVLHEMIAYDFIHGWKYAKAATQMVHA